MNYTISLIFVALTTVAFVHSLPKLSDVTGTDEAKLMSYVRALKALKKGDSSEESEEVDWKDLFFTVFFDNDSSEENATSVATKDSSEEFDPSQFVDRLNGDIEKAYSRRCKKISGSDETITKIKAAYKEFGVCLKTFSNDEELVSATSKIESNDDIKSLIQTVCRKRATPMKCIDDYLAVVAECSFPSEIETDNTVRRVVGEILDLVCLNDASDLVSLVFGEGRQCLMENLKELRSCAVETLYAMVKGFVVKLIENETFEFKMDDDDCKAFDASKTCFVSAVENCVDPAAKNYYTSLNDIVRKETSCAKGVPTILLS